MAFNPFIHLSLRGWKFLIRYVGLMQGTSSCLHVEHVPCQDAEDTFRTIVSTDTKSFVESSVSVVKEAIFDSFLIFFAGLEYFNQSNSRRILSCYEGDIARAEILFQL